MTINVSGMRQHINRLGVLRKRLEGRLMRPQPMMVGSVIRRNTFCRKPGCTPCAQGVGHGPYYYLSWKTEGRTRYLYLGKATAKGIKLGWRYQEYQRGMARLNKINREIIELLWKIAQESMEEQKR